MSSNTLQMQGDLVSFMMELKAYLPFNTNLFIKYSIASPISCITTSCHWYCKRIELTIEVIIDYLKRDGEMMWIPHQDMREGTSTCINDMRLLDFVLKLLTNHIVGYHLVRRVVNPISKVLEYDLQEIQLTSKAYVMDANMDTLTRNDLWKDIKY